MKRLVAWGRVSFFRKRIVKDILKILTWRSLVKTTVERISMETARFKEKEAACLITPDFFGFGVGPLFLLFVLIDNRQD